MAAVAEFPGFADEGFGFVADAFVENFRRGTEMGASCAVYHRGRLVVDLYGGTADTLTSTTSSPHGITAPTGSPRRCDVASIVGPSDRAGTMGG